MRRWKRNADKSCTLRVRHEPCLWIRLLGEMTQKHCELEKSMCVCDTCDVRCTVYTSHCLQGNLLPMNEVLQNIFKRNDVLPILVKTTTWMNLSNLSKTRTTNSIATGFSILDVGEFVGWEELEDRPFDRLCVSSDGSF